VIRRLLAALLFGASVTSTGCAVGRFIAGAPAPGATASSPALVVRRCSGCHEAPVPASMTADAWQAALVRMRRRLQLPEADWDSLAAMR
jgi:hypothetical protein